MCGRACTAGKGRRCRKAAPGALGPARASNRPETGADATPLEAHLLAAITLGLSFVVGAAHPHLFFRSGDVAGLRAAAAGTHQEIASNLTKVLSQHFNDPAPSTTSYDDPRLFPQDVCAWAFGYQLTGDTRYAAQAQLRLTTYLGWRDWGFGEIARLGEPDLNIGHFLI